MRDLATVGGLEHLHPQAVRRQVLALAAPCRPLDDGRGVLHRLVKQGVHGAHRRPDHMSEGVHVLAPLLRKSEHVGQHLVDKSLSDIGYGIDLLATAAPQPLDQRGGFGLEVFAHLREGAG